MNDFQPSYKARKAAARYVRQAHRVESINSGPSRIMAAQAFAAARASLVPRELAIIDLILLKGRTIPDLSREVSTPQRALGETLALACEKLATHYAEVDRQLRKD